jgi:hypothetical protein
MISQQLFDFQCELVSNDSVRPDKRIEQVLRVQRALGAMRRAEMSAYRLMDNMRVDAMGDIPTIKRVRGVEE